MKPQQMKCASSDSQIKLCQADYLDDDLGISDYKVPQQLSSWVLVVTVVEG